MTPEQMKNAQLTSAAGATPGSNVGKIDPELRDLLVRQAGEAAEAQTRGDIDAHNARIELRERHAAEARALADALKPAAAPASHEKAHHKAKGK